MPSTAILYYFSGTGNTLALAKAAASMLEQQGVKAQVINVAGYSGTEKADLTGVFFPVYAYGAPRIINRFLRRMPHGEGRAAFVIANAADSAGSAAGDMARTLATKGYKVLLAEWVKMPSNYILGKSAVEDHQSAEIIAAGVDKVTQLMLHLVDPDYRVHLPPGNPFYRATSWTFLKGLKLMGRFYKATDKCTGCGACMELCPTGTISFTGERPVWGAGCEGCLRCVNLCPADAIEVGSLTVGKKRYKYWQGKT